MNLLPKGKLESKFGFVFSETFRDFVDDNSKISRFHCLRIVLTRKVFLHVKDDSLRENEYDNGCNIGKNNHESYIFLGYLRVLRNEVGVLTVTMSYDIDHRLRNLVVLLVLH